EQSIERKVYSSSRILEAHRKPPGQIVSCPISHYQAGQAHRVGSHRNPSPVGSARAAEPGVTDEANSSVVKVRERVSERKDRLPDQLFAGGTAVLDFGALVRLVEQG